MWVCYGTHLGNKKHVKRRNDPIADIDFSVCQATYVSSKQIKQANNQKQSGKALWERVLGLGLLFIFSSEFSFVLVFGICPTDMCCLHGVSVCPSVSVDPCRMLCPPHLHQEASSGLMASLSSAVFT